MFFEKKTRDAMDDARERQARDFPHREEQEPVKPEQSDLPAMMCSAYLIFIPLCLAIILVISLLAYFFMIR